MLLLYTDLYNSVLICLGTYLHKVIEQGVFAFCRVQVLFVFVLLCCNLIPSMTFSSIKVCELTMSTLLETRLHAALATELHTPPPTQIYYQQVCTSMQPSILKQVHTALHSVCTVVCVCTHKIVSEKLLCRVS